MEPITLVIIGVPTGLIFLGILAYSGLFHRIRPYVGPCELPSVRFAYKFNRGPYNKTGPLFAEATTAAPSKPIMALYYDNPCKVKPEDLRCAIGPLLDAGSGPYDDTEVALTGRGYTVVSLPQTGRAIHVQFPFRTRLSILIAIRRVWPAIGAYLKQTKLVGNPWIEVYDERSIKYFGLLEAQEDFFMRECDEQCAQ